MSPDLATALRDETPSAPSELRQRIAYITATAPPPRRTFSFRRTVFFAAPAVAIASLMVAVVVGLGSAIDAGPRAGDQSSGGTALESLDQRAAKPKLSSPESAPAVTEGGRARALAPTPTRAQDVQANLRVLVDDPDGLSTATQRALRTTRRLGGYLVTVDYGTPEPSEGTATIRVRIPVSRVQSAIVSFSGLGRILAQRTQITDLQQQIDELTRQIRRAKGDKQRIAALRRERLQLNRRAAYATVDLALTTHEPEPQAASPSRFDRAVDDATGVLKAELAVGAYILIVASPFLLLLGAAFAGSRAYRRHADQRLLERA